MSRASGKFDYAGVIAAVIASIFVAAPTALISIGKQTSQIEQTKKETQDLKSDVAELHVKRDADHDAIAQIKIDVAETRKDVQFLVKRADRADDRRVSKSQ